MTDFTPEDVGAMRRDGSLRDLLRAQIADGKRRRQPAPEAPAPRPPGHIPGAWPTGSRPPGPLPPQPAGAWAAALQRYRDWLATTDDLVHHPGQHCPCGCTPNTRQTDPERPA